MTIINTTTAYTGHAWRRGRDDCRIGMPQDRPPYKTPQLRAAWLRGWFYAQAQIVQEVAAS